MPYVLGTEDADFLVGFGDHDTLEALGGDDTLIGLDGNDVLVAAAGDDYLRGGEGSDTLDGGAGMDTASYISATSEAGVIIYLNIGGAPVDGQTGADRLIDIENVIGSRFDDFVIGDQGRNILNGDAGHDRLIGLEGDDFLAGGEGDDQLFGGAGTDQLVGGAGSDWACYTLAAAGVIADLDAQLVSQDGDGGADALNGIENLLGSAFTDFLVGNAGNNILEGAEGEDMLVGLEGNDYIAGGEGDDYLVGGAGIDYLDGGGGADWAYYDLASARVIADINIGAVQDDGDGAWDVINFIENISASAFDDILIGGEADNTLRGNAGADTLAGSVGSDFLLGGDGNDEYRFYRSHDADVVVENDATPGNTDIFVFGGDIDHDQLWFIQSGNNLAVSVIGTNDQIVIVDWYSGSHTHIEEFHAGEGLLLD